MPRTSRSSTHRGRSGLAVASRGRSRSPGDPDYDVYRVFDGPFSSSSDDDDVPEPDGGSDPDQTNDDPESDDEEPDVPQTPPGNKKKAAKTQPVDWASLQRDQKREYIEEVETWTPGGLRSWIPHGFEPRWGRDDVPGHNMAKVMSVITRYAVRNSLSHTSLWEPGGSIYEAVAADKKGGDKPWVVTAKHLIKAREALKARFPDTPLRKPLGKAADDPKAPAVTPSRPTAAKKDRNEGTSRVEVRQPEVLDDEAGPESPEASPSALRQARRAAGRTSREPEDSLAPPVEHEASLQPGSPDPPPLPSLSGSGHGAAVEGDEDKARRQLLDPDALLSDDVVFMLARRILAATQLAADNSASPNHPPGATEGPEPPLINARRAFITDSLFAEVDATHSPPQKPPRGLNMAFMDDLLVPMHHRSPNHWTLLRINLPTFSAYYYDSVPHPGRRSQAEQLARAAPWRCSKFHVWAGPLQSDGSSCGPFVLAALRHVLAGQQLHHLQIEDSALTRCSLMEDFVPGPMPPRKSLKLVVEIESKRELREQKRPASPRGGRLAAKRHRPATETEAEPGASDLNPIDVDAASAEFIGTGPDLTGISFDVTGIDIAEAPAPATAPRPADGAGAGVTSIDIAEAHVSATVSQAAAGADITGIDLAEGHPAATASRAAGNEEWAPFDFDVPLALSQALYDIAAARAQLDQANVRLAKAAGRVVGTKRAMHKALASLDAAKQQQAELERWVQAQMEKATAAQVSPQSLIAQAAQRMAEGLRHDLDLARQRTVEADTSYQAVLQAMERQLSTYREDSEAASAAQGEVKKLDEALRASRRDFLFQTIQQVSGMDFT